MAVRRLKSLVTAVLALLALAILIGLGTWQVERLAWKEGLIAQIESRRLAPPLDIGGIEALIAAGEDPDYRAARATGTLLNDKERYFLATLDGDPGFYVYTPLQLADGRYLLVNRGFVPEARRDPAKRPGSQPAGPQEITGLARARLAAKPSMLVPDNDIARNFFYWKDLSAMAASAGLPADRVLPVFLDAGPSPAGSLPVGGVTQIDLPNNHLQYALTWYGLALGLLIVLVVSFRRRVR